jgi:hypothetical protein
MNITKELECIEEDLMRYERMIIRNLEVNKYCRECVRELKKLKAKLEKQARAY